MKKLFAVAAAVLAGTAMLAFAGCDSQNGSLAEGGLGGGAGIQAEAGAKNAYALGAVTTAGLLANATETMSNTAASGQADASAGDAMKEQVSDFNEYFNVLDTFLDEGAIQTSVTENDDTSYDFAYKMTVTGKNPDGSSVSHTMYYTETEAGTHEENDDDEREVTVAYELTGVLEMDGVAYEMTGYRMSQTETEGREEESSESLWIMATDPTDTSNYVRMDLETESEQEGAENETEREYVYRVYRDGKLTEQTSVSFETEDEDGGNETEYELSIFKDGERSLYEVERAERLNGTVSIGVRYRTAQGSGRFVVTQTKDGTYTYEFDDGSRLELDDRDD